jgi:hypothetical protein
VPWVLQAPGDYSELGEGRSEERRAGGAAQLGPRSWRGAGEAGRRAGRSAVRTPGNSAGAG